MCDYDIVLWLFMADVDVYHPCYQSTLLAILQQRCGYSASTSCR